MPPTHPFAPPSPLLYLYARCLHHPTPYSTTPFPLLINQSTSQSINQIISPPPSSSSSSPSSRQSQEPRQHFREIRRAQPGDWIPPLHGREARRAAALVATAGDIVQHVRGGVEGRVDEADAALADVEAGLVDEGEDGADGGGGGGGAVDEGEGAVDGDDVVGAVGADVGVSAGFLGVVELSGGVWGRVVREPALHGGGLVARQVEDVREAAAGVDDSFAGLLGLSDGGAGLDLGGTHGGDVRACWGEGWVEHAGGAAVVGPVGVDALASVAGDAVVA